MPVRLKLLHSVLLLITELSLDQECSSRHHHRQILNCLKGTAADETVADVKDW